MKTTTTTDHAIVIPFEAVIALFNAGCLDPALLGYCLPIAIAEQYCPEVLRDLYEIEKIANILGETNGCNDAGDRRSVLGRIEGKRT